MLQIPNKFLHSAVQLALFTTMHTDWV